jgi:hypothetical protein
MYHASVGANRPKVVPEPKHNTLVPCRARRPSEEDDVAMLERLGGRREVDCRQRVLGLMSDDRRLLFLGPI